MKAVVALAALLTAGAAQAESLRCSGGSIGEGDSRVALRYRCGEPLIADTTCAPVYASGAYHPVPSPFVGTVVPCVAVEEWLYDRGPGNLAATVRLRNGVVQSIHYGQRRSH